MYLAGKKGIALPLEEWAKLVEHADAISASLGPGTPSAQANANKAASPAPANGNKAANTSAIGAAFLL